MPTKRSRGANAATTPCARASNRPKHNHSKIATDLFKVWFYANLRHPFPSDEVKAEFADRTGDRQAYRQQTPPRANARVADVFLQSVKGAPCCRCACSGLPHRLCTVHFLTCRHDQPGLSFTQVATWFINARKRVWKPFVHDQNNDDVGSTMDVDDSAHALAFASGAPSIDSCSRAPSSSSFSESDSVDHDMSPCVQCDEEDYVPPPPPTHADRREYATVGIKVSPSRNMLCVGMMSPDRSQMYVGMLASPNRSQVYIVVPDPHDDYQGLELFSSSRVPSPCVSPLQGNRPSQSMQAFHNRTTPRYP